MEENPYFLCGPPFPSKCERHISIDSQNWFVASLAVADLTLGLVVMPFSLAQEVMGYWVFGEPWCQGRKRLNLPAVQ